jgi:hypothetical protein
MSKRENHRQDLLTLLAAFLETSGADQLITYLVSNSNLPGRRANLELAQAFADTVAFYAAQESARLWDLCARMTAVSADEAPVNDPQEFVPFCGAVGIGSLGSAAPTFSAQAMAALRRLANDSRWRMREAVPMGLHRLLAQQSRDVLEAFENWVVDASSLELRAVAAAVAEPTLLKDAHNAHAALKLHQDIVTQALKVEDRQSDEFRALRKALGYTLSIVICALPQPGFQFMRDLIATQDKDVLWIVKENLKKNRLVKRFPTQVAAIKASLG